MLAVNFHSSVYFNDEDDTFPYVFVMKPEKNIEDLISPDEIVIPMAEIRIEYSHPLTQSMIVFFNADNGIGFTRIELLRKVCSGYRTYSELHVNCSYEELLLIEVKQIEDNLFGLVVEFV